jgi:ubiquinol-cytochrome c reductase cytochrome b subunit
MGVRAMGAAIVVLFILPWIDRNDIRSIRYRSTAYKVILGVFIVSFIVLGRLGMLPVTPVLTFLAQVASVAYFGFFVALFFISKNEKTMPLPERVSK